MKTVNLIFLVFLTLPVLTQRPSGEQILKQMDKNLTAKTQVSISTMIVHSRRGTRTIKAKTWMKGRDTSFTEYLAPPRDKGTKMLKIGKRLWLYSPRADRIIQIAGHMLRQSVMGSDLSYEDLMESPHLWDMYTAQIIGEEKWADRNCWLLKLMAKKRDVAYPMRKIWVDQKRLLPLREERFARSGRLLKTTEIQAVFRVGHRWYPKKILFKDVLKKGRGTEFVIESIQFDVKIPDYIFTKAALRR